MVVGPGFASIVTRVFIDAISASFGRSATGLQSSGLLPENYDSKMRMQETDQRYLPDRFITRFTDYLRSFNQLPFSILPRDQLARIQENQNISRPQPQSFASRSDPTLIIGFPTPKRREAEFVPPIRTNVRRRPSLSVGVGLDGRPRPVPLAHLVVEHARIPTGGRPSRPTRPNAQ
ncbi:MAG: hypothetical protein ACJ797_26545 [Ktedonobacteraceae bacterium]